MASSRNTTTIDDIINDIAIPADIRNCTMFRFETDCDGSSSCVCCECSGCTEGGRYNGHCQCRPKELTGNPTTDRDIHEALLENLHWNVQGLHMYIQTLKEDPEGKYTAEWKKKQIEKLACDLYWYAKAYIWHRKQVAACTVTIQKLAEEAAEAEELSWTTVTRKH
jgi:hypothetical protein